jgi:hypothetical protein
MKNLKSFYRFRYQERTKYVSFPETVLYISLFILELEKPNELNWEKLKLIDYINTLSKKPNILNSIVKKYNREIYVKFFL